MLEDGQQHRVLAHAVHRRVDEHHAGQLLASVRREAQGQGTTHGQTDCDDGVVLGGELVERALDGCHPVGPRHLVHVLPAGAVAGQQRHLDGVPARGEVLRPGTHRGGAAGESVDTSTPILRPPVSSGRAGVDIGATSAGSSGAGVSEAPPRKGIFTAHSVPHATPGRVP